METAKKNDFVEIKFTGYSNGSIFDSNIEEDLKKIKSDIKPQKTIVVIGQGMIVPGLDKELEGKEIGKNYEIKLSAKDGFGERKRDLMKTIPLKAFTQKNINPRAGMVLSLDDMIAKIIAVSGARVITDFNNPLAGKELEYKFKIVRKIEDEKEKCTALFELMFKFVPEFEVKDEILIRGPKEMEIFVNGFKEKFKELIGKEIKFELKEKEDEKEEKSAGNREDKDKEFKDEKK